jgi:hypothetical protein
MEKREEFHKEFKELLKKFRAEIQIEDVGGSYSPDHRIIVDFAFEVVDGEGVLHKDLDLGTWENGDDA